MLTEDDIQGHWQRRWLRAPGFEDSETRVRWMQCGAVYADVRIPAERPDIRGARCLADLSPAAVRALAQAEGFAGTTQVVDSVCTWTRAINWHGMTESVDAGHLAHDDTGDLLETGVHAEYAEKWARVATGSDAAQVLEGAGMRAYLVHVSDAFVLGVGQPDAPSTAPLLDALRVGKTDHTALSALFQRLYVFGRWEGSFGRALLSTNPFLEGKVCLREAGAELVVQSVDFEGRPQEYVLRPMAFASQRA
ncbi:MAG: hypothetical protein AAF943_15575 [Pseudomonadota bacterium]